MQHADFASNPFALMTCPEMIFAVIERSDRLTRLQSRICRPLDKPRAERVVVDAEAFDQAIEAADEPLFE